MSIVKFKPSPEEIATQNYPANLENISLWEDIERPIADEFRPWNGWPSLNVLVAGNDTAPVEDFLATKDVPADQVTVLGDHGDSKHRIYDFGALRSEGLMPASFDLVIAYNALNNLNKLQSRIAARNIASLMADRGKGVLMLVEPNPAYYGDNNVCIFRGAAPVKDSSHYESLLKKHKLITPGVRDLTAHLPIEHAQYLPYDRDTVKLSPKIGGMFLKPPQAEDYGFASSALKAFSATFHKLGSLGISNR